MYQELMELYCKHDRIKDEINELSFQRFLKYQELVKIMHEIEDTEKKIEELETNKVCEKVDN